MRVVHLKCPMINKMPGDLEEKFQNLMVGYAFMFGHPAKLLFMGQDFGQLRGVERGTRDRLVPAGR